MMAKPLISLAGKGFDVGSGLMLLDNEGVLKIGYNLQEVFLNHKAILDKTSVKLDFSYRRV